MQEYDYEQVLDLIKTFRSTPSRAPEPTLTMIAIAELVLEGLVIATEENGVTVFRAREFAPKHEAVKRVRKDESRSGPEKPKS